MADLESKTKPVWSFGCGALAGIDIPTTEGGSGGYCQGGVASSSLDKSLEFSASLGISAVANKSELFADSYGEGTSADKQRTSLDLRWGTSNRNAFGTDNQGKITSAVRSGTYSSLSLGWQKAATANRELFGETFEASNATETFLTVGKESSLGLELWLDDTYIMPEVGVRMLARNLSEDTLIEWPGSARGIELYFAISLGFGLPSHRLTKNDTLTKGEVINHFSNQASDALYNIILYLNATAYQQKGLAAVEEIFGSSEGVSTGSMWTVPSLLAVSNILEAGSSLAPVSFYLKAPEDSKVAGVVAETIKGLGFLMAGADSKAGDAPLLISGLAALNNLSLMGIANTDIDKNNLYVGGFILGATEILLSTLAEERSVFGSALLNAGSITSAAWAMNPEQGKERVVRSTSYKLSPIALRLDSNSGGEMAGAVTKENELVDSSIITGTTLTSPVIIGRNAAAIAVNSFEGEDADTKYTNMETPSSIHSYIAIGKRVGKDTALNLKIGAGPMVELRSSSVSGGAALLAGADLEFGTGSKRFTVGAYLTLSKTSGAPSATISFPIGLKLGN